jgi:DNA invertase Pin-like site-specific DNA recombinase
MAGALGRERQSAVRGYYRVPKKNPANRVEGALADLVREKFAEGWPKARIAREFRLNRRTVARICTKTPVVQSEPLARTESLALRCRAILQKRRYFLSRQRHMPAQNQDEPS